MSQSSQDACELDDFDRIVASFNQYHVDFMIIGGWAVVYHGHVRMTEDLDIYIRPTEDNAKRAVAAIEAAGGGCPELKPEVFTRDNGISLGEIPVKVDVISKLPGVDFDQAWSRRATGPFGLETVSFISREDLIRNKRAVARPKDLLDVNELEAGRDKADPRLQAPSRSGHRSLDPGGKGPDKLN